MLSLDVGVLILFILIVILQAIFTHVPLGNENSNVRRIPWITFSIIILNVLIYLGTLPVIAKQEEELLRKRTELLEYMEQNPSLLFDKSVRKKLVDEGIVPESQWEAFDTEINRAPGVEDLYKDMIGEMNAALLRADFDIKIAEFKAVLESHLNYKFGLAPNGKWKFYQLITCLFMHGGIMHLVGNMLFFFAVGFSLEDLWGRGIFLAFYLLGGVAACLPSVISPLEVPLIGASGAISAAMGAFLIRLPKTKIKIGWILMPWSLFGLILVISKRLFGVIKVPSYIYIPYYFLCQIVIWWMMRKVGAATGVAYSAHFAGAAFGLAFAAFLKYSKIEEKHIHQRIEDKISFSASPVVTEALELMDKGQFALAEQKLQSHLQVLPNDANALLTLIQVHQYSGNFTQINSLYSRLIRLHLSKGDKEAALYTYDSLLSAYPEDKVKEVKLPLRDWMMICGYVKELGMYREAAIEFERMAQAWPDDPLAIRACMEGGDAALLASDEKLALRLYEQVMTKNPTDVYASRARLGIDKCIAAGGKPRWDSSKSHQQGATKPEPLPKPYGG
jgi:membrane associated rhomboid family serine protease